MSVACTLKEEEDSERVMAGSFRSKFEENPSEDETSTPKWLGWEEGIRFTTSSAEPEHVTILRNS